MGNHNEEEMYDVNGGWFRIRRPVLTWSFDTLVSRAGWLVDALVTAVGFIRRTFAGAWGIVAKAGKKGLDYFSLKITGTAFKVSMLPIPGARTIGSILLGDVGLIAALGTTIRWS